MKMRKGQTAMEYLMTYGWAILIIMVVVAVLFYLGVFNLGSTISQCTFPPGFTCVSNKLQATTAKLYLKLGQGTGHNIKIFGVNCTQQTSTATMASGAYISYLNSNASITAGVNDNISVSSGSTVVVADAANITGSVYPAGSNAIICSDQSGKTPRDVGIGSTYNGKIYLNYTETDTGLTRIAVGTYTAKYEA
jgi:hypothetical protein